MNLEKLYYSDKVLNLCNEILSVMILRVYIFSFILLFSSRLVFSKSEIPNHFQACKGVYGEMNDQQVLCIEREENFKSIDKLAASTHQIIVQLNPKDKNRLKIPDELKTFIQKKLDDQYQRISNIFLYYF